MARVSYFPPEITDYLALHHIITLSTASFTGLPHANTVAYANDIEAMYFAVLPDSAPMRNIADNKHVSFTIDDYTTEWRKVRELQGMGACAPADQTEFDYAIAMFQAKFARTQTLPSGVVHVLRPIEMHFVDYSYDAVAAAPPAGAVLPGQMPLPTVHRRRYALDDAEVPVHAAVSTNLDRSAWAPGQVIFRPGDPVGQYYVVIEGEVEVRGEGYGADQTVTRVGPGELFGDQASLKGQRGAFTAHAVAPTVLLAVHRDSMRELLLPRM